MSFIKIDKLAQVVRGLNTLVKQDVLVGIADGTTEREDDEHGPMNNATLGYIHEHGSPAANIPARPFLTTGIEDAQDKITARLKKAGNSALDGKKSKVLEQLESAGIVAEMSVKNKINSGGFDPLADSTLKARARRKQGTGVRIGQGAQQELDSRAKGNEPGTETALPLIDTGQLRNSITHVIRSK